MSHPLTVPRTVHTSDFVKSKRGFVTLKILEAACCAGALAFVSDRTITRALMFIWFELNDATELISAYDSVIKAMRDQYCNNL